MMLVLVVFIHGLTEISKEDYKPKIWSRNAAGTIDAIPKSKAKSLYRYMNAKIQEVKKQSMKAILYMPTSQQQQQDPVSLLQKKSINGRSRGNSS